MRSVQVQGFSKEAISANHATQETPNKVSCFQTDKESGTDLQYSKSSDRYRREEIQPFQNFKDIKRVLTLNLPQIEGITKREDLKCPLRLGIMKWMPLFLCPC
jgi:hypothetical protein